MPNLLKKSLTDSTSHVPCKDCVKNAWLKLTHTSLADAVLLRLTLLLHQQDTEVLAIISLFSIASMIWTSQTWKRDTFSSLNVCVETTVPNNSYRFWADLLIEGHDYGVADIHNYWSKMP